MPASLAEQLYARWQRALDTQCKVCGAVAGSDGERVHVVGCYMLGPNGGGSDRPVAPCFKHLPAFERAAWERVAEVARQAAADRFVAFLGELRKEGVTDAQMDAAIERAK